MLCVAAGFCIKVGRDVLPWDQKLQEKVLIEIQITRFVLWGRVWFLLRIVIFMLLQMSHYHVD